MRLIDADAITRDMIIDYLGTRFASCCDDIVELLDDQPTAYDVDKVVEEIENRGNYFIDPWVSYMFKKQSKDIVKRGGVDEQER